MVGNGVIRDAVPEGTDDRTYQRVPHALASTTLTIVWITLRPTLVSLMVDTLRRLCAVVSNKPDLLLQI